MVVVGLGDERAPAAGFTAPTLGEAGALAAALGAAAAGFDTEEAAGFFAAAGLGAGLGAGFPFSAGLSSLGLVGSSLSALGAAVAGDFFADAEGTEGLLLERGREGLVEATLAATLAAGFAGATAAAVVLAPAFAAGFLIPEGAAGLLVLPDVGFSTFSAGGASSCGASFCLASCSAGGGLVCTGSAVSAILVIKQRFPRGLLLFFVFEVVAQGRYTSPHSLYDLCISFPLQVTSIQCTNIMIASFILHKFPLSDYHTTYSRLNCISTLLID